ncbi:MAG: transporter substrate-binding domain-containing protein [Gammaproteobacteria bacterium]|nr:MAG: transporter substrate-binding domain-containing protein [Gammaproteobacteria bacterium]
MAPIKTSQMTLFRLIQRQLASCLCAVVFVMLFTTQTVADSRVESIIIATESWDKYTNLDGSGLFLDITRAVFEPQGVELQIEYVPYERALHLLEFQQADAMYGTYSAQKERKSYLLTPRLPIDREQTVAIFDRTRIGKWMGQRSLPGRALAWVRGYDYHEYLDVQVEDFAEVRDTQQGLKMLQGGRIDFFLDHAGSLLDAITRTGFDTSSYQIEDVIEENVYMAFATTEKGQKLASIYDQGVRNLIETGKLQKIFARYGLHYPFSPDGDE